jgi:hypothetical protein
MILLQSQAMGRVSAAVAQAASAMVSGAEAETRARRDLEELGADAGTLDAGTLDAGTLEAAEAASRKEPPSRRKPALAVTAEGTAEKERASAEAGTNERWADEGASEEDRNGVAANDAGRRRAEEPRAATSRSEPHETFGVGSASAPSHAPAPWRGAPPLRTGSDPGRDWEALKREHAEELAALRARHSKEVDALRAEVLRLGEHLRWQQAQRQETIRDVARLVERIRETHA